MPIERFVCMLPCARAKDAAPRALRERGDPCSAAYAYFVERCTRTFAGQEGLDKINEAQRIPLRQAMASVGGQFNCAGRKGIVV